MIHPFETRRLLAWGIASLLASAALGAVYWTRAEARFQSARGDLLVGREKRALPVFLSLERLPFVGARAAAGRELALRLQGGPPPPPAPPPGPWREGLAAFPAEALLDLARTRPVPVRRAIAIFLDHSGERLAALDLAALELDAGQDDLARVRVRADPEAFRARALGREVMAVLDRRSEGPEATIAMVRDRVGRRLGHLDAKGLLTLDDEVEAALVPEAARAVLVTARGTRSASASSPGLRLSLDLDLSRLAQDSLGFNRGSVVLLDPQTGGVLAAVSDAVTRAQGGTPAFEERREPASISKVITAAAGLRAGLDVDDLIRHLDCRGAERFGNGIVWCYPAGPLQGLDQAMALSCNMAFAHVGARVGRAALLAELRLWGFDRDFALAPAGRVIRPDGDLRQLADLSIGLEATNITPLHGALLATVLANEGRMPEPMLLAATEGPMGLEPRFLERLPFRDVIAPETVPVLAHAMQAVALYGTAAGVAPPGFPIAMKTGTGAEWRLGYHANYVGVAPWPNPVVAFGLRITHEPTSARVNRTAREVLRALLEGLRRRMPDRGVPHPSGDAPT